MPHYLWYHVGCFLVHLVFNNLTCFVLQGRRHPNSYEITGLFQQVEVRTGREIGTVTLCVSYFLLKLAQNSYSFFLCNIILVLYWLLNCKIIIQFLNSVFILGRHSSSRRLDNLLFFGLQEWLSSLYFVWYQVFSYRAGSPCIRPLPYSLWRSAHMLCTSF